jgi:hypothetical protein
LTENALDHEDGDHALELLEETRTIVRSGKWTPEYQIEVTARLAELRHRSGDAETAKQEADAARELFQAERSKIVDIFRGAALRPLAETYQAIGDTSSALAIYKLAVEEGVINPNSRPRAEDLSALCCSMALAGVEPDADLWARILEVRDGLGDPW